MVIAIIFILVLGYGLFKRVDCFSAFRDGAKNGIETCVQIIPAMVGLMVGIAVFRASGAMEYLIAIIKPVTSFFGIPEEVLPLALLRPVSGSASLALLNDIYATSGPDSAAGMIGSVMMGSTETVFYTIAIYLSSVGVKKTAYIVPIALICSYISFAIACIIF